MSFVAVLIATSIVFILVLTAIIPLLNWPSFKISVGNLPVKITGYIFGPIVGAITGFLAEIISFCLRPIFFHWGYLLAFVASGLIPGLVSYFMRRSWRRNSDFEENAGNKINVPNLIITFSVLAAIIVGFTLLIVINGDEIFPTEKWTRQPEHVPLITDKWVFLGISIGGISSMFIGLFFMMWKLKKRTFNEVLPIVTFSAILEIADTLLISVGDRDVLGVDSTSGFVTILTTHFALAPVKIWVNLLVIATALHVVMPLITHRVANGWVK